MADTSSSSNAIPVHSICASALDLIGNTPLVALRRIHAGPGEVFAKAEFLQPGGSLKDRPARWIIQEAYRTAQLTAGQPVVEMTSGNMGAGLAVVCNVLGNPFIAVMSAGNSPERAKMMRSLGAEVVLVPQVDGAPGQVTGADIEAAAERARQLARERGGYYVDQFNNPDGVRAHQESTGPEIWRALGERLDAFVAAVGTGGTFVGAARFLKSRKPAIVCAAVEPVGSEVLAGKLVIKAKHLLQGTGYGYVPPQWDRKLADTFLAVSDEEATTYRTLLATQESLHVGFSAAANVCAAIKLAKSGALGQTPTIATILPDTGFKY
jgi:cysteine synthase A